ncbi:DUF4168 domain-containing protein [Marinilabiliaceae bacterium ANBcel2]|nr:DUF4168 domain-containing protein [Marinilabiliaceae bacterium ANBcel2]
MISLEARGKKIFTIMLTMAFVVFPAMAQQFDMAPEQQQQESYSDEEVTQFVEAVVNAMPIQQEAEQKMVEKIEEEGMELDEFNQIATQIQQTGSMDGLDADDVETFQEISEGIQMIQMEIQQDVNEAIEEAGLTPGAYQQMMAAYQTNPELRQAVDEKMAAMQ